jgi:hypothetical protein
MKRFLKYIGLAIAMLIGLGYLVANHSIADETKLICTGNFYKDGKASEQTQIFFKFQKYRWWVHLWGDSDGVGYIEYDGLLDYLHDIEILDGWGDIVFDKFGGSKRGRYSAMSKTMRYVLGGELFEGKCMDGNNMKDGKFGPTN